MLSPSLQHYQYFPCDRIKIIISVADPGLKKGFVKESGTGSPRVESRAKLR